MAWIMTSSSVTSSASEVAHQSGRDPVVGKDALNPRWDGRRRARPALRHVGSSSPWQRRTGPSDSTTRRCRPQSPAAGLALWSSRVSVGTGTLAQPIRSRRDHADRACPRTASFRRLGPANRRHLPLSDKHRRCTGLELEESPRVSGIGSHTVAQVDHTIGEPSMVQQLKVEADALGQRRFAAAHEHRAQQ